jgi:hypothetical protein
MTRASRRAAKVGQQPEKAEQSAIVQLLRTIGASVYVIGTKRAKGDYQGTRQTPGIPDLYVFLPSTPKHVGGIAVWIEVKAEGGRLSVAQIGFEVRCRLAGAVHLVGGRDMLIDFLKQNGWLK